MEDSQNNSPILNRFLSLTGKTFLFWLNLVILFVADIAALGGFYYVVAATQMNTNQISQLFTSLVIFSILANILIAGFSFYTSPSARIRLAAINKDEHQNERGSSNDMIIKAWKEIFYLPSHLFLVDIISLVALIILPAVLFVRFTSEITSSQIIHIIIGCFLSGSSIVLFHNLLLDIFLQKIRSLFFSSIIEDYAPRSITKIRTRLLVVISYLVISTIIMLAGIGFQRSINASLPGADLGYEITQFQKEATILGAWSLFIGIILAGLISRLVSKPLSDLSATMDFALAGNYQYQVSSMTSDEISHVVFQFNSLLGKLHNSTIESDELAQERTENLSNKSRQLQVVTNIFKEISTTLELNTLLERSVQLISDNLEFYNVGIFLLDEAKERAILQSASSDGGKTMIVNGYRCEVNQNNIIGRVIQDNKSTIIMDTTEDLNYKINHDLPLTLSQIVIPLSFRGNVIGALDIHSSSRHTFTEDNQVLLQTLADQIALTIQNSYLAEENRLSLEKIESILSENVHQIWGEKGQDTVQVYRYTPTSTIKIETNAVGLMDEDKTNMFVPISLHGEEIGKIILHRKVKQDWSESERAFTNMVAYQIGLALENTRLLETTKQRIYYEQFLGSLTTQLGLSVDTDTLLEKAIRELHQLPNVTEVSVVLKTPEDLD